MRLPAEVAQGRSWRFLAIAVCFASLAGRVAASTAAKGKCDSENEFFQTRLVSDEIIVPMRIKLKGPHLARRTIFGEHGESRCLGAKHDSAKNTYSLTVINCFATSPAQDMWRLSSTGLLQWRGAGGQLLGKCQQRKACLGAKLGDVKVKLLHNCAEAHEHWGLRWEMKNGRLKSMDHKGMCLDYEVKTRKKRQTEKFKLRKCSERQKVKDGDTVRYTNGVFGSGLGKLPWTRCESICRPAFTSVAIPFLSAKQAPGGWCYTDARLLQWGSCQKKNARPPTKKELTIQSSGCHQGPGSLTADMQAMVYDTNAMVKASSKWARQKPKKAKKLKAASSRKLLTTLKRDGVTLGSKGAATAQHSAQGGKQAASEAAKTEEEAMEEQMRAEEGLRDARLAVIAAKEAARLSKAEGETDYTKKTKAALQKAFKAQAQAKAKIQDARHKERLAESENEALSEVQSLREGEDMASAADEIVPTHVQIEGIKQKIAKARGEVTAAYQVAKAGYSTQDTKSATRQSRLVKMANATITRLEGHLAVAEKEHDDKQNSEWGATSASLRSLAKLAKQALATSQELKVLQDKKEGDGKGSIRAEVRAAVAKAKSEAFLAQAGVKGDELPKSESSRIEAAILVDTILARKKAVADDEVKRAKGMKFSAEADVKFAALQYEKAQAAIDKEIARVQIEFAAAKKAIFDTKTEHESRLLMKKIQTLSNKINQFEVRKEKSQLKDEDAEAELQTAAAAVGMAEESQELTDTAMEAMAELKKSTEAVEAAQMEEIATHKEVRRLEMSTATTRSNIAVGYIKAKSHYSKQGQSVVLRRLAENLRQERKQLDKTQIQLTKAQRKEKAALFKVGETQRMLKDAEKNAVKSAGLVLGKLMMTEEGAPKDGKKGRAKISTRGKRARANKNNAIEAMLATNQIELDMNAATDIADDGVAYWGLLPVIEMPSDGCATSCYEAAPSCNDKTCQVKFRDCVKLCNYAVQSTVPGEVPTMYEAACASKKMVVCQHATDGEQNCQQTGTTACTHLKIAPQAAESFNPDGTVAWKVQKGCPSIRNHSSFCETTAMIG